MRQMHQPEYQLGWESFDQMLKAGRHNKSRAIYIKNKMAPLNAGNEDRVFVYYNDNHICVLSLNTRLGYIGLDVFDKELRLQSDIFINKDSYLYYETISDIGIDADEHSLLNRLYNFVLEHCDI